MVFHDSLIEKVSAVDLVKILSSKTGGSGGGGRPDFAQVEVLLLIRQRMRWST